MTRRIDTFLMLRMSKSLCSQTIWRLPRTPARSTLVAMEHERRSQKSEAAGVRMCPQCGAAFTCGIAAGTARCWCFDLSRVMPVRADTACLCPGCLARAIQQTQEESSEVNQ